ncbi:MAG: hypothetical protein ACRC0X_08690 [Brevinema sp.]
MKKMMLLTFLFCTRCPLGIELEQSISPTIFTSISGRIFQVSIKKSFIFFAEDESVFIITKNVVDGSSINSLYMLKDGVEDGDIVSFRLEGEHPDNGNYIAVLFHQKNPDKISISVQKNRVQAVNAVQFTHDITGEQQILEGIVIRSPGMYLLQELSPIMKTPDYQQYINILNVVTATNGIPNRNAIMEITDFTTEDVENMVKELELTFETNITTTMPIYSFADTVEIGGVTSQVTRLWGAIIDIQNSRLQILQSNPETLPISPIPTKDQIYRFEQLLRNVKTWEYKFSNSFE